GVLRVGEGPPAGAVNVVVVQADERRFGLAVGAIHDTEEIVVKPLQKLLKGAGVFAGATILGDGRVALILDVSGLAQRAGLLRDARPRAPTPPPVPSEPEAARERVLLFAARGNERMAVPLGRVARLEEFPAVALEALNGREFVQYRGGLLPLVRLAPANGAARDVVPVVVLTGQGQQAGLVVERILDVVDEAVVARAPAARPEALFTAVVDGRATEFLDADALLARAGASGFVSANGA
ncbi:MAG: chemotaxis protein CheW, partial [Gemmataceae bacterium]|nr:chemotaxis protein CheW [Gemmataceae bacterium]